MKNAVKRIAILLTALFCFGALCVSASASGRGETVTMDLTVGTYENVNSGAVALSYDANSLEIVSGAVKVGSPFDSFTVSNGKGVFGGTSPFTVSGNIFSVTFRIKDNAPFTSTAVSAAVTIRRTGQADEVVNVTLGTVTVICTHSYSAWTKVDDNNHQRICSICNVPETAAHSWNGGVVTKEATCKETGVKTYTCTACGATKTEEIAKTTTHIWGSWTKANDNQHKRVCSVCSKEETANHGWNNGTVTKAATCKETGVKTYTCTSCSATKTEEIAKTTTHTWGSWTKANDNQHKRVCSVCSKEEAAGHTWNQGVLTEQATCAKEGTKTYTCTACRATKTEAIAKTTDHKFGAWEKKDDTNHKRTCSVCSKEETAAHAYGTDWQKDASSHYHVCSICGGKKDEANHTPGPAATESTPQTCTTCGYIIAPALGHTHNWSTAWTNDETGHWYTCSGCNEKKDAAAHVYDNDCDPDCNVCGYKRTTEHAFELKHDETSHWQECKNCGEIKDKEDHVPGPEATEDNAQVCLVCDYEIAPKKVPESTFPEETDDETKDDDETTDEKTDEAETTDSGNDGKGGKDGNSGSVGTGGKVWPWILAGAMLLAAAFVIVMILGKRGKMEQEE